MRVTKGRALAQRFYDVADEIDLVRAEALVRPLSRRPDWVRSPKQIKLPNPPLEMSLGKRPSPIPSAPDCEVMVRVYDVGAIGVTFALELPTPLDPEQLVAFASLLMAPNEPFTIAGRVIADEVQAAIKDACKAGAISAVTEDYTILRIHATEPRVDADTLGDHFDLARLLLGETGPISARERAQQSHASFSYGPDELVVLDWNSAFIYDPSPSTDLVDLLELASMQALELRAYDDLVGRELARLYDELEAPRVVFRSQKYRRLSHEIMRLFVDVTEMSDRIENALTILGDSWFARVHHAAVTEFQIPRYQRLLNEKLEVLRQINEMLVDQITSAQSLRIELTIVLLIVTEIFLFLRFGH